MKLGAKIFGALGGILLLYLLLGILLPGQWEARVESTLPAPPEQVFPFLNSPEKWALWNAMPDSGLVLTGPSQGAGAGIEWDDPRYGSGRYRIVASHPPNRVDYEVEIEGGALKVSGTLELSASPDGSLLRWLEEGDFGWNPLLGYAARGMASSQGEAMRSSIQTLVQILEG
jgi:uncharacterized protein YndB with AHSA1/START domain